MTNSKKAVKIQLFSKRVPKADGKGYFRSYWTKMFIVVKGQEDQGKQQKSINVKFRQSAIDNSDYKQADIKNGILTAVIDAPFVYEVVDNGGKLKFPEIWVREIVKFEQKESYHAQSDFFIEVEEEKLDDYAYEEPTEAEGTEIKDEDLPF